MVKRNVWERDKPKETPKQFIYFQEYMNLPFGERSIKRVAEITERKEGYLRIISSRNNWVERASAHDSYVINRKQEEKRIEAEEFMGKQFSRCKLRQEIINENILNLKKNPEELSVDEIAKALKYNTAAYKDNLESFLRLAGLPQTIQQNLNDTELNAKAELSNLSNLGDMIKRNVTEDDDNADS